MQTESCAGPVLGCAAMRDSDKLASEYRRMASQTLEIARRMSLDPARAQLTEIAQCWVARAEELERQDGSAATMPNPPSVHQQPQQQAQFKDEEE